MLKKKSINHWVVIGMWLIATIWPFGNPIVEGAGLLVSGQPELLQVKVQRLGIDPHSDQPVVFLAGSEEKRALLIWIDFFEARAIYSEIEGIKHPRPLTHDLIERILQKVDGKIHHIVVTHVKENIYYATLVIERENSLIEIDARPSDCIVMALKFKAPIFVSRALFEEMSVPLEEKKEIEEEYGLSLQNLSPSLAKYLSFESDRGALVSGVRAGSPAEKDGIKAGDIFVEIGGQVIEDVTSLHDALAKSKTSVKARIFRKARFLSVTLHPNPDKPQK